MPVRIFVDGNQFCALIGDNIQEGCAGFGKTIPEALRALADEWNNYVRHDVIVRIDGDLDDQR